MPTPTDDFHTRLTDAATTPPLTIPPGSVLVSAADLNALLKSEIAALASLTLFTSRITLTPTNTPLPAGAPLDVTLLPAQSIVVRVR